MDEMVKGKEKKEKPSCKDQALFWLEYGNRTETERISAFCIGRGIEKYAYVLYQRKTG